MVKWKKNKNSKNKNTNQKDKIIEGNKDNSQKNKSPERTQDTFKNDKSLKGIEDENQKTKTLKGIENTNQKFRLSEVKEDINQKDKNSEGTENSNQKIKNPDRNKDINQNNKSSEIKEGINQNDKSLKGMENKNKKYKDTGRNENIKQNVKSSEEIINITQKNKNSEGIINTNQKNKSPKRMPDTNQKNKTLENKMLEYPSIIESELSKKEIEEINILEYIQEKIKDIKIGKYQKYFSYLEYIKYSKTKKFPPLKKFLRIHLKSANLIEFTVNKIVSIFKDKNNYIDKRKTGFYRDPYFNEFMYGIIDPCIYESLFDTINEESMSFYSYKKDFYINNQYQILKGFINEKAVISYLRLNINNIHEYPRISIGLNKYFVESNGYLNFNFKKYYHEKDYIELDYVFSVNNIKDLSPLLLKVEYKYEYSRKDSCFHCVEINNNITKIFNDQSIYFCEIKSSFPKDYEDIENIVFNLVESISYFKELYLTENIVNKNKKYIGLFIYDTFPITGYQKIICDKLNLFYSPMEKDIILYSVFFSSKISSNNTETLIHKVRNLEVELNNTKIHINSLENRLEYLTSLIESHRMENQNSNV